jgi:hypothetical protein
MQELMMRAGWDVSRSQGSDTAAAGPATFVVGTDGEVKARSSIPTIASA